MTDTDPILPSMRLDGMIAAVTVIRALGAALQ